MQEEEKDLQEQEGRESRKQIEVQMLALLIVSSCCFHSPAGELLSPIGDVHTLQVQLLLLLVWL